MARIVQVDIDMKATTPMDWRLAIGLALSVALVLALVCLVFFFVLGSAVGH